MSGHKRLAHHKKAKGGKVTEYNAKGSPELAEVENKKEGFKKGGKAKMKDGGHAEGKKAHHHLGKAKRGGAMKKCAAGGSPFTNAANRTSYTNGGKGDGHVNEKSSLEDKQSDTER